MQKQIILHLIYASSVIDIYRKCDGDANLFAPLSPLLSSG